VNVTSITKVSSMGRTLGSLLSERVAHVVTIVFEKVMDHFSTESVTSL
jgi:hypothetical protein